MSLLAPHTWRCFYTAGYNKLVDEVSSTYVEMFLKLRI